MPPPPPPIKTASQSPSPIREDGSGSIDRAEFLRYILVREGKAGVPNIWGVLMPDDSMPPRSGDLCWLFACRGPFTLSDITCVAAWSSQVSRETLEQIDKLFDSLEA